MPVRLTTAVAVGAILAAAGFALIYLPWYDRRMLMQAMRSMLDGAMVGAFVGGLLLHRYFGLPGRRGWLVAVTAYLAAIAIGGAVGGPIALPGEIALLTEAAVGAPMALLFALGVPVFGEFRPFLGLGISAVAVVAAHLAGTIQYRCADAPASPRLWPLAAILIAPFLAFGAGLAWESWLR